MPEILCLALALAMDAFSVSVLCGMSRFLTIKNAALMAAAFGAFQLIMPVIGNGAALLFYEYTRRFGPFIVFAALSFIGARMIIGSFGSGETLPQNPFRLCSIFALAFATSVDALGAGVSIGSSGAPILLPSAVIGAVAAALSAVGLYIGAVTGRRLPFPAERVGGAVLILLGIKALIEAFIL